MELLSIVELRCSTAVYGNLSTISRFEPLFQQKRLPGHLPGSIKSHDV